MSEDRPTPVSGSGQVTERGERALEAMRELLELSNIPSEVELTETRERIKLDVYPMSEEDTPLLIGRQGRTLSAYQFVLNRMVNRFPDRKPINVDVAGHAERRKGRLEALAERLARRLCRSRMEIRITGMTAADRRTVHMALSEERGVHTWSDGMGIGRCLVVSCRPQREEAQ